MAEPRPDRPGLDVDPVRADFPALHQEIHGRPLVYLDSAASAHKPQAVIDAVAGAYSGAYSNVHRGVHTLSQRATDAFETARCTVARFLGAESDRECVFVRGATEAINLVAHGFLEPRLERGDEIVVSHLEHHSNIVPWQLVAERTGAVLRVVPIDDRGQLDLDAYRDLLGERTRMVSIIHVSNALGTVNPVRDICRMARERGIPVMLDGAQATPHAPVDVEAIGCDFYALSGHKVYGPTGIGVLWGRTERLESMRPWQGGGDMIRSVSWGGTTYAPPPSRFEAGTPNIAGAIGLGAALDYVDGLGRAAIASHEADLLAYATARLAQIDGLTLVGTAESKAPVVSFTLDGVHPHDIGTILDHHGVAIRAGHHCTQPLMDRLGVPATARASFGVYNRRDEVDVLVDAIEDVRSTFSRPARAAGAAP